MIATTRSHRRAVRLILALLLVSAVSVVCFELNWIHRRRTFLATVRTIAYDKTAMVPVSQTLPEGHRAKAHSLAMWLFKEKALPRIPLYCPQENPSLFATYAKGHFAAEAVEDLEQVKLARRLVPEAKIDFQYFKDRKTGKLLNPQRPPR